MIKVIYFDFGGVLVNYEKFLHTMCSDFGLNTDDFFKFYDKFDYLDMSIGKITTDEFWQKCIEKFKLKNAENYDLLKSWVLDYRIIKPINELVYSLENKIDMGIISNIPSGTWEPALKYGMVPNIKYKKVFLSYQLGLRKPDPEIYKIVQKESGVKGKEILFVDDIEENLVVPQSLGWKTVLFNQNKAEEGVKKIKNLLKINEKRTILCHK